jgi:hypothetical protein
LCFEKCKPFDFDKIILIKFLSNIFHTMSVLENPCLSEKKTVRKTIQAHSPTVAERFARFSASFGDS